MICRRLLSFYNVSMISFVFSNFCFRYVHTYRRYIRCALRVVSTTIFIVEMYIFECAYIYLSEVHKDFNERSNVTRNFSLTNQIQFTSHIKILKIGSLCARRKSKATSTFMQSLSPFIKVSYIFITRPIYTSRDAIIRSIYIRSSSKYTSSSVIYFSLTPSLLVSLV